MSDFETLSAPHVMIVTAPYYKHIVDGLMEGALATLKEVNATYEVFEVPGALEIPGVIRMALKGHDHYTGNKRFDAYIALGCVLRGETSHYDVICNEAFRGIQQLVLEYSIAVGNGILTCEDEKQALVRSDVAQKNKGGEAARACLAMLDIKRSFGLYPRD